jgi:hypothetical protein
MLVILFELSSTFLNEQNYKEIELTTFLAPGDLLDFMSFCLSGPKDWRQNISKANE